VPTYAYACTACAHEFDAQQTFAEASLTECPECQGRLRKKFGAVGVVFKGSGFYRTDSRNGSGSKGSSSGASESTSDSTSPAGTTGSSEGSCPVRHGRGEHARGGRRVVGTGEAGGRVVRVVRVVRVLRVLRVRAGRASRVVGVREVRVLLQGLEHLRRLSPGPRPRRAPRGHVPRRLTPVPPDHLIDAPMRPQARGTRRVHSPLVPACARRPAGTLAGCWDERGGTAPGGWGSTPPARRRVRRAGARARPFLLPLALLLSSLVLAASQAPDAPPPAAPAAPLVPDGLVLVAVQPATPRSCRSPCRAAGSTCTPPPAPGCSTRSGRAARRAPTSSSAPPWSSPAPAGRLAPLAGGVAQGGGAGPRERRRRHRAAGRGHAARHARGGGGPGRPPRGRPAPRGARHARRVTA
jgi:putative FmdB family regulatory protein